MTASQHYINLYRTMMLQIRRSVVRGGVVVNAKPLFMLALIEDIRRGLPNQNMFAYDECLASIYYEKWKTFYPNMVPTPICKPFYHLANDGFWNIKWKSRVVERRIRLSGQCTVGCSPRRRNSAILRRSNHIIFPVRQEIENTKLYGN